MNIFLTIRTICRRININVILRTQWIAEPGWALRGQWTVTSLLWPLVSTVVYDRVSQTGLRATNSVFEVRCTSISTSRSLSPGLSNYAQLDNVTWLLPTLVPSPEIPCTWISPAYTISIRTYRYTCERYTREIAKFPHRQINPRDHRSVHIRTSDEEKEVSRSNGANLSVPSEIFGSSSNRISRGFTTGSSRLILADSELTKPRISRTNTRLLAEM